MRLFTCAVAVTAVVALTAMMNADSASSASPAESRLRGKFAANITGICNYTTSSGDTVASNTQSQVISGIYDFDGAGGLTIEVQSDNFNVPAGTRSTTRVAGAGTYEIGADNSVATDVATDSETIDGVGLGSLTHVPIIKGRFVMVGDELFRMSAGPPAEETVIISPTAGGTVIIFRKCSRVGTLRKVLG